MEREKMRPARGLEKRPRKVGSTKRRAALAHMTSAQCSEPTFQYLCSTPQGTRNMVDVLLVCATLSSVPQMTNGAGEDRTTGTSAVALWDDPGEAPRSLP